MKLGSVQNIIDVYNQANPSEKEFARNWYAHFRDDIINATNEYEIPYKDRIRSLCGITAAYSPQRTPRVNLLHLRQFLADPRRPVVHSPVQDKKARLILNGADPDIVLSGPKENAFYHAICGNETAITIDSHAYNIWLGHYITTDKTRVPKGKALQLCKDDYVKAASLLGETPAALQAITWTVWRRIHQTSITRNMINNNGHTDASVA